MAGLSSAHYALTPMSRVPELFGGVAAPNVVVARVLSQRFGTSLGGVPIDSESAVGGNSDVRDLAIDCQQP